MNLSEAVERIKHSIRAMNEAYGRPVFDEWAVVNLQPVRGQVLEYSGPRFADFQSNFLENLVPLRSEMELDDISAGDFGFSREAAGQDFDAYIMLGSDLYLLCNHTGKDMEAITRDPSWKRAQLPFVQLSEKFRDQPLSLT